MKIDITELQEISSNDFTNLETNLERIYYADYYFCYFGPIRLVIEKGMFGFGNINYKLQGDEDCNMKDKYELFVYQDPEIETKKHIVIAKVSNDPDEEEWDFLNIRYIEIDESNL